MERRRHSPKITENLADKINRLRQQLVMIIDIEHGLLQELFALDVLAQRQIEEIRSKVSQ
jgi:hypothetical protein